MWVSLARYLILMHEINHAGGAPREKVEAMFNSISASYDRLNRLLSFGTDRRWRRRAINLIGRYLRPQTILDVATGTGDLAIAALRLDPQKITGIDISEKMLALGREKITRLGHESKIEMLKGDSAKIMFPDVTFDAVMSAFGVRNFEDTGEGLSEMFRVLRPGGIIMVLEFSKPERFPMKQFYGFYFTKILPLIGKKVSGDPEAYSYLPESVLNFPDNEDFLNLLGRTGFVRSGQKKMTGGIASIYYGFRP
jgi:demethylmenaquinone methyltransferase / 2-methoxy-6-polyprenyl-1,4-benzoquinol methylase